MRRPRETFVAGVYAACIGMSSENMVKLLLLQNFCYKTVSMFTYICKTFVMTV